MEHQMNQAGCHTHSLNLQCSKASMMVLQGAVRAQLPQQLLGLPHGPCVRTRGGHAGPLLLPMASLG